MRRIRIAVVEDDAEYAGELRGVFKRWSDFQFTGAFTGSVPFLTALTGLELDVILLDINLPRISGLECIRQIHEFLPHCRVIMLTVHDDDDLVLKAFLEGADGYLLKDATPAEIRDAIYEAVQGGAPMSSRIARKVIRLLAKLENQHGQPNGRSVGSGASFRAVNSQIQHLLSKRELEVLQLLAAGKRYAEIAGQLCISLPTVKTHINHIYEKLRARNKVEAISRLLG